MRPMVSFTAVAMTLAAFAAGADDASFLKALAQGNRAEIKAGELAGNKASTDVVRDFGMMLVKDHGAALQKAASTPSAGG